MSQVIANPSTELRRLINGYQITQAIHVATVLGIADLLKDGPRSIEDLATVTGSHQNSLYRLLRALAAIGVFREEESRFFSLTPLSECLCADAPQPIAGWAGFVGLPYHWQAWSALDHAVRTGEYAFLNVHGIDPWQYRSEHPELSRNFDQAMADIVRSAIGSIVPAYDFSRFDVIADIGGGSGALLAAILARYSEVHGILFDQPHVVAGADQVLQAAGVLDRCRIVGGSFFDAVPEADAYILKSILHDWDDQRSIDILRTCRRTIAMDGTLLVIEYLIHPPNEGAAGKFSDLNMLVANGGEERTPEEYAAILDAAGFQLVNAIPAGDTYVIIEGIAS